MFNSSANMINYYGLGVFDKLGLGWEVLHERNSGVILLRMGTAG